MYIHKDIKLYALQMRHAHVATGDAIYPVDQFIRSLQIVVLLFVKPHPPLFSNTTKIVFVLRGDSVMLFI